MRQEYYFCENFIATALLTNKSMDHRLWPIWYGSIDHLTVYASWSTVIFSIKHVDCVCLTATPNQLNTFTFTKFTFLKKFVFKNDLKIHLSWTWFRWIKFQSCLSIVCPFDEGCSTVSNNKHFLCTRVRVFCCSTMLCWYKRCHQ